jgi:formylglycine-generating enzyme
MADQTYWIKLNEPGETALLANNDTRANVARISATRDVIWIPGGAYRMGSDDHYPEEAPSQEVRVVGFFIDRYPITNRHFAAFVAATRYRTVAERALDPKAFPGMPPAMLRPGSMVFRPSPGPVDLRDVRNWWSWKPGAYWRHPEGRGSSIAMRLDHPVVHVAFEDAAAYASWSGAALPTEAEWEFAARGGLDAAEYAWGNDFNPDGRSMAHTWRGEFPWRNLHPEGCERTSPVGSYEPNGYGLFDMIGNVWEWTIDWFSVRHGSRADNPCCIPESGRSGAVEASLDPTQPDVHIPRKVVKGGSFLCAPNYCRRYRPAARHAQMVDTGMSHIGFRCVMRSEAADHEGENLD